MLRITFPDFMLGLSKTNEEYDFPLEMARQTIVEGAFNKIESEGTKSAINVCKSRFKNLFKHQRLPDSIIFAHDRKFWSNIWKMLL